MENVDSVSGTIKGKIIKLSLWGKSTGSSIFIRIQRKINFPRNILLKNSLRRKGFLKKMLETGFLIPS